MACDIMPCLLTLLDLTTPYMNIYIYMYVVRMYVCIRCAILNYSRRSPTYVYIYQPCADCALCVWSRLAVRSASAMAPVATRCNFFARGAAICEARHMCVRRVHDARGRDCGNACGVGQWDAVAVLALGFRVWAAGFLNWRRRHGGCAG
jgi:hypothetical protein